MPGDFKSLKGQLLLDGGKLRGSFFYRTVVLICQHDPEGAFGLTLNRASGKNIPGRTVRTLSNLRRAVLLNKDKPDFHRKLVAGMRFPLTFTSYK